MSLLKKLTSFAHHAGIEYALALNTRNEVKRDGLALRKTSNRLAIEWRARDIHPWDRDIGCSPEEKERLFNEQCFSDTEAAIRRLFSELPTIDEIQFRVVRLDSDDELLTGLVERPALEHTTTGATPRGRLHKMGINVCAIGFCLLLPLLGGVIFLQQIPGRSPIDAQATTANLHPELSRISAKANLANLISSAQSRALYTHIRRI